VRPGSNSPTARNLTLAALFVGAGGYVLLGWQVEDAGTAALLFGIVGAWAAIVLTLRR
jgi:hypothetical protein